MDPNHPPTGTAPQPEAVPEAATGEAALPAAPAVAPELADEDEARPR